MNYFIKSAAIALLLLRQPFYAVAQGVQIVDCKYSYFRMDMPANTRPARFVYGDMLASASGNIKHSGPPNKEAAIAHQRPDFISMANFTVCSIPYTLCSVTYPQSQSLPAFPGTVFRLSVSLPSINCIMDANGTQKFALKAVLHLEGAPPDKAMAGAASYAWLAPVTIHYN